MRVVQTRLPAVLAKDAREEETPVRLLYEQALRESGEFNERCTRHKENAPVPRHGRRRFSSRALRSAFELCDFDFGRGQVEKEPGRVPGFGREARVVVGLCPWAFELLWGFLVETYFFPRCLLTLQGSRGDSLG